MKKHFMFFVAGLVLLITTGCSSSGPATIGAHGKESILSGTRVEGFQLLKVDARSINVSISEADGMEIKL